jgi:hypothetical protein
MTPAQVLAVMQALRPLIGTRVVAVGVGIEPDVGLLVVDTPAGHVLNVRLPLPGPVPLAADVLVGLAAWTESQIRTVLTPYETAAGRGFNSTGRGVLRPGERGFSASEGAV